MRAKSLLAQQAILQASHVETANGAILEREERIRQKVAYDARMNAVLRTAADGIIVTDDCGVIETFNAAAQAIFGYHAMEMVGKRLATLLPLLDKEVDTSAELCHETQNGSITPETSVVKSTVCARTGLLARSNWRSVRPAWRIDRFSPCWSATSPSASGPKKRCGNSINRTG